MLVFHFSLPTSVIEVSPKETDDCRACDMFQVLYFKSLILHISHSEHLGGFKKILMPRLHPVLIKSETLGWGPDISIIFFNFPGDSKVQWNLRTSA